MESTFSHFEIHKDLLDFILKEKTGFIHVQPGDRKLFFENGHLVFAKSGEKGENFADILVEMDQISEEELYELKNNLPAGESLGKVLREKGFATPQDLGTALKHQIMRIITKVIMAEEGTINIHPEDLPQKMPKLKIATLPLFVKNILLIESPEFPQEEQGNFQINRSETFDQILDQLNLPDHYEPYIRAYDTMLTSHDIPEELDDSQFKKLTYIFRMMGMLDFVPLPDSDVHSHTDPFDHIGLSDDSADLLDDGEDLFNLEEASDGEDFANLDAEPDFEDFDPLAPVQEEPMEESYQEDAQEPVQEEVEPLFAEPEQPEENLFESSDNSYEDETVVDHDVAASLQPPPFQEQEQEQLSLNSEDEELDDSFDLMGDGPDIPEDLPRDEDPIEALNRALEESESANSDSFEDSDSLNGQEVFNDQHETVPGEPIEDLKKIYEESKDWSADDLSDGPTIPGDFSAEDLAPTQKLPLNELDSYANESPIEDNDGDLPSFETPEPERDLSAEYIMPDAEHDQLQYFEKSRPKSIFIIPVLVVLAVVAGFLFRDRIPFLNFGTDKPSGPKMEVQQIDGPSETQEPLTAESDSGTPQTDQSLTENQADETLVEENTTLDNQEDLTQIPELVEKGKDETSPSQATAEPEKKPIKANLELNKPVEKVEEPKAQTQPATFISPGTDIDLIIARSREDFRSNGNRFTLVFMVACQRDTIEKLMEDAPGKSFYITPRPSNGQLCYCLSWGAFRTWNQAHQASGDVPAAFTPEGEKPWVLKVN